MHQKQDKLLALAERFAALADDKKSVFLDKLVAKNISFDQLPMVARSETGRWYPLSPAQQALWLACQVEQSASSYHLSYAIEFSGGLDIPVLEQAFNQVLSKHAVLRSRFTDQIDAIVDAIAEDNDAGAQVLQTMVDVEPFALAQVAVADEADINRHLLTDIQQPFDLSGSAPFRIKLYKIGEQRFVLSMVVHHIVFDNHSFVLLTQELVALYWSLQSAGDKQIALAEPGLNYVDYCLWQRDLHKSAFYRRQCEFWRSLIDSCEVQARALDDSLFIPLQLPNDGAALRDRGALSRRACVRRSFVLEQHHYDLLVSLAKRLRVSMYTLLMSAFALTLHQVTQRSSFMVGTSVANRPRSELEKSLGFFVNTLLLPVNVDTALELDQWLRQQRDMVGGVVANQDVLLDTLLQDTLVAEGRSFSSLSRVFFVLLDNSQLAAPSISADDLDMRMLDPFDNSEAGPELHFDLCLRVFEARHLHQCHCQLEYRRECIDDASVAGIEATFVAWIERLLDTGKTNRTSAIGGLQSELVYGKHSRAQVDSNYASVDTNSGSVIDRLEVLTLVNPSAIAIRDNCGELDYAALLAQVVEVAQWYRAKNCRPHDIIALQMVRHRQQVIHSLALLAIGCAYVPLEPTEPKTRLGHILRSCQARLLVVDEHDGNDKKADGDGQYDGCDRVSLADVSPPQIDANVVPFKPVRAAALPAVSADQLAYIIFTSGSTGQPKGVVVSHRAILAYARGIEGVLDLAPDASLASMASVAADLAYTAVFGALLSGRCLQLFAADVSTDAAQLVECLQNSPVDCLKLVPTHLDALLKVTEGDVVLPRHCLVLGGEPLPVSLVNTIRQRAPQLRIINHYGPTETSVGVSSFEVDAAILDSAYPWRDVPIGKPLSHCHFRICDCRGHGVAPGLAGELWITGPSLAEGYWQDNEKTAQSFITRDGVRYYRTGDQVKQLADGNILFLRRLDEQIKIRGFRVELRDIEHTLLALDGVEQCFVTFLRGAESESARQDQIAAAVAGEQLSHIDLERLKVSLTSLLPGYMQPSVWLCYDHLPLNQNGKTDRAVLKEALAASGSGVDGSECNDALVRRVVSPRDILESGLCAIWAELLARRLEDIGVNQDFVDLGGDSILGLQMIARARKLDIWFSPKQLFAARSIENILALADYPQKPYEARVVDVWSEVLEQEAKSFIRTADFIASGGDSILALGVIARLRQQGFKLSPKKFFAEPTIATLAAHWLAEDAADSPSADNATIEEPEIAPFEIAKVSAATLQRWRDDPEIADAYPASPAQQGMLFHNLMAPDKGLYINQIACAMRDAVDAELLQSVLEILAARHSVFRSRFYFATEFLSNDEDAFASVPHMVVDAKVNATLDVLDWRHYSDEAADAALQQLMSEQLERGFDLQHGPLMSLTLIQRSASQELLWTFHHAVIDGWSIGHCFDEMMSLYGQMLTARSENGTAVAAPRLMALPGTGLERGDYRDYIAWLQKQDLHSALNDWKRYLDGFEQPNSLPLRSPLNRLDAQGDCGRTSQRSDAQRGQFISRWSTDLSKRSRQAARSLGVTHNTFLQGSWAWLIAQLSRQDDVVFGVTLAGRPLDLRHAEQMIGAFINTVPLRVKVPAAMDVDQYFVALQQNAMALQERSFAPLLDIQRQTPSANRLFQSLWVFENYPLSRTAATVTNKEERQNEAHEREDGHPASLINELGIEISASGSGGTELPLMLWIYPGDPLTIHWVYDAALVDGSQVELMATLLERAACCLLEGLSRKRTLAEIELVTDIDRQVYRRINQAAQKTFCGATHLYDCLQETAARFPDHVAVREATDNGGPNAGNRVLTYRTLNKRVNQLAHYLLQNGVESGDRVAVHLPRTASMVVAVLAVQATGAAYVPLDPMYPARRLQMILDDVQAAFVIDSVVQPLARDVSTECVRLLLDQVDVMASVGACSSQRPMLELTSEALAYVIFTSGSTGRPKGVAITQASLMDQLHGVQDRLALSSTDRLLAIASLCFDISIIELFLPLLVGAETVIVSQHETLDADFLRARLCGQHALPITLLQATPAGWQLLLNAGWRRRADLTALCGGEALTVSLARALMVPADESCQAGGTGEPEADHCAVPASLLNCYGPTETTVWSSFHTVTTEKLTSIGHPLANNTLSVLNAHGRLQPVGVAGELWIGGKGVAMGYFGRPDLSAERFRTIRGERFYATGDLAVLGADHHYYCLGRLDHQVKIRGFRIELGEIETALQASPDVRQARVFVKFMDTSTGKWLADSALSAQADPRLVAYWVQDPERDDATSWSSLKAQLQQHLPDYMVPAYGVELDRLPLTPNGKIDRKALPLPGFDVADQDVDIDAWLSAASERQRAVYLAFGDTLKLKAFSPKASFFELGGHSLLAMQLVVRIQLLCQNEESISFGIREFFEAPSVEQVCEKLSNAALGSHTGPLFKPPALQPADESLGNTAPLSYAQQRLWALDQLQGGASNAYNMAAGVRLSGAIDLNQLARAFGAVIEQQSALRTKFVTVDGLPLQQLQTPGDFKLTQIDLRELTGAAQQEEITDQFRQLQRQPFSLRGGRLLRVRALICSEREVLLILCLHHIVFDAWSAGVLLQQLAASYMAQQQGKNADLPSLAVNYLEYARWQREYLKGEYLEHRLQFWREYLADAPTELNLPFAKKGLPATSQRSYEGGAYTVLLPVDVLKDLNRLALQQGATLFMILVAAYYLLLRAFTKVDDLCFGTDLSGRGDPALDPIVGFFVNVVPLRFNFRTSISVGDLLAKVKAQLLDVYEHQDVPFDLLVDDLNLPRIAGADPLVQSLLVLQNAPFNMDDGATGSRQPDISMEVLDIDSEISRFDISLFATETKDGLASTWKYRKALYREDDVVFFADQYTKLLARIAAGGDVSCQELCLAVLTHGGQHEEDKAVRRKKRQAKMGKRPDKRARMEASES